MKRDFIIKVTVDNSGCDFEDDVDLVLLTVNGECKSEVVRKIASVNKKLHKENDDGECLYSDYGWNTNTLMTEVCEKYGWSWEYLNADIDVCI